MSAIAILRQKAERQDLAQVAGWWPAGIVLMQSSTNQGFAIILGGSKSQATLA
jgi:hypothetical protein